MDAKRIGTLLATLYRSPVHYARNFVLVPNVSWGFLPWEADLLCCSKSGYLTEVEIKISLSDWRADALKQKWQRTEYYLEKQKLIKRFYYAAPKELATRYLEVPAVEHAGIIAVSDRNIEVLREPVIREHRKLTDEELLCVARLGCVKYWDLRQRS